MTLEVKRKFGFNVFNQPPEEFFEYAKENKLRHIEINLTQDNSVLKSFDNKRIRNIKRLSEKHNVKLSIHLPFTVNISEIIRTIRKSNILFLLDSIKLAERINATHVTAHIGNFYWFPVERIMRQKALSRFLKYLKEILDYCKSSNIYLALENVVPIPHGSEFYLLGDNIDDFKYIFDNVDSQNLKFCLDTGHANIGGGIKEYINCFKDKLVCVHYHDNSGKNDEHLPVGKGTVQWNLLAEELESIKYRGPLVSECRNIKPHEAALLFQEYFTNIQKT